MVQTISKILYNSAMEHLRDKVLVLDLDGVVNWRVPAQKSGIPFLGYYNPEKYKIPVRVRNITREINDQFSLKDIYDAIRHLLAPIFPDVARLIKELENTTIYGSTGRQNTKSMVYATFWSLRMAGIIDKFDDIYFRPTGFTTTESKVAALYDISQQWDQDQILVADDNPGDILPMARVFPNIRFFLIRDLTTSRLLRGVRPEEFPGVQIKPTLRAALSN